MYAIRSYYAQGKDIRNHEKHRRYEQFGTQEGDENQWGNDSHDRLDDQRNARVHSYNFV